MTGARRFVACALVGATTLALAVVPAFAQTKWDLSTVWPDSNYHTQNAKRFAREVKAASGGAIDITVKDGGQLGFKGPEQLRAVRDGLVPMADILIFQQIGDEPMAGIDSLPFLVNSFDELKIFYKYVRPEYEKMAQKHNQRVLYLAPWPTVYLFLKVKASTLEGLRNIKIRIPDKNAADMLAAVGMAPVLIPWGETIPALASGTVAGVSTSAVSAVDGKFWELLKPGYIYPTNHFWTSDMVTVNLDAWKRLKPNHQKAVLDTARKLEPEFWASSLKADDDSLKRLKEGGMEVVSVPPAMLKEFRDRSAPLLSAFIKRVPAAERPIKGYLAEIKRR